ncbi:MAG: hypothetical protein HYW05_00115 [Candidatus Diapherotrites archaeon]|nr:hypothetical protein [Candidatus Diapherotrites archaeon]
MPLKPFWEKIIRFRRKARYVADLQQNHEVDLFTETLKEWTKAGKKGLDWPKFNELRKLQKQIAPLLPKAALLEVDKLYENYKESKPSIDFQTYVQNLVTQKKRI